MPIVIMLAGQTTPDVIELVADKYRDYDLPGGWILPNDGYGCGYTELEYVVEELHDRGFYTGLWTENGVSQIAWEVGTAGTSACKLDVAWVGSGYLNALNACKALIMELKTIVMAGDMFGQCVDGQEHNDTPLFGAVISRGF